MRRNIFVLILGLLATASSWAQRIDSLLLNYSVRYVKEHKFMQDGDNFNVIDLDIEWPDVIDFKSVEPLQENMSKLMFGMAGHNFDSIYSAFLADKGRIVSAELTTLPDDQHFCYFNFSAKIRDHEPGKWIVYDVEGSVEPQQLSPHEKRSFSVTFTFDIARQKVLTANTLLNLEWIEAQSVESPIIQEILKPLPDDYYNQLFMARITQAWPTNHGAEIGLHVECHLPTGSVDYTTTMPYVFLSTVTTRGGRQLIEKEMKKQPAPHFYPLPLTWLGDTIYNKVDVMPVAHGGKEGMSQYFSNNLTSPLKDNGRITVTYVVDTEGELQDIRVVNSLSPESDRKIAELIRLMPPYTPGRLNGKAVPVRITLPLNFK